MAKNTIHAKLEVSIMIELDDSDDAGEFLSEMHYNFMGNEDFPNSRIIETEIRDWEYKETHTV